MNISVDKLYDKLNELSDSREGRILQNCMHNNSLKSISCRLNAYNIPSEFTIDLSCKDTKTQDQKKTGFCWLYAAKRVIKQRFDIDISVPYLAFFDKIERVNAIMHFMDKLSSDPQKSREVNSLFSLISDGGTWHMFLNIVKKYGVVPESEFMHTFHTENTTDINAIIKKILCSYGAGKISQHTNVLVTVIKLLYCSFGKPPSNFVYKGRNTTPKEFGNQLNSLFEACTFINSPMHELNKNYSVKRQQNVLNGLVSNYKNISIDLLKKIVIQELKEGNLVWFACDMSNCDLSEGKGVMDSNLYEINLLLNTTIDSEKATKTIWTESAPVHAMIFCGVYIKDEKPVYWKVENSWGRDSGKNGFITMSDKWFEENVFQIVSSKSDIKFEETITLPPWDPMGILASASVRRVD